jgi:restriction system protein
MTSDDFIDYMTSDDFMSNAALASVIAAVGGIVGAAFFGWRGWIIANRKFRAMQIANIDTMSGVEFEQYLQRLLNHRGFSVSMTRATGDLGVDLIASLRADKFAVQVKRSRSKISRRAVSDAVAGILHYRCNRAMVITNNYFTRGAITLARSTNCTLVNRDLLAQWIVELQNAQSRSNPTSRYGQGPPPILDSTSR